MVIRKIKTIGIAADNRVGLLAEITSVIAVAAVNITGIAAFISGGKAHFSVATSDNRRAMGALRVRGYAAEERGALEAQLENKPGALDRMAQKIREAKIDLKYVYCSAKKQDALATVIFSTDNDDRAAEVLK